jgi:hypothetical protein
MAEPQIELTPEEEARIKWESLLLGKTQAVVEPVIVEEVVEASVEGTTVAPEEIEDSPEAVLSQLFKSMVKGVKD